MAGPCTEMVLIETATQAIVDTASGRELLSGSAAAKGVVQDKTTGMEARVMGEAARSAAGMNVAELNKMLLPIVADYEKGYNNAPAGKTLQVCYDDKSIKPTAEYLEVYDKAVKRLNQYGFEFKK